MTYEPRKLACTHCGQHVEADVSFAGQTVACPCCQQLMRIPAEKVFRSQAAGPAAPARRRWRWVLLVLALGGAAAVYFIPAARRQADAVTAWAGLKPATLMIDGESHPATRKDLQEVIAALHATLLPPGQPVATGPYNISATIGGNDITFSQSFQGVRCTLDTLRHTFGEPSRVLTGKEEIPLQDARASSFADWHYYYHTGKTGPLILIIEVRDGESNGGRLIGPPASAAILLR